MSADADSAVDKSRLLGLDAVGELVRGAWTQVRDFAGTTGPEIVLAGVLVAVYALAYVAVSRLAGALARRVTPPDAWPITRRVLRTALRSTFVMLALVSVTALFPPLSGYGPALFRVYVLVLTLAVTWGVIHRFLHVQTARWQLDSSLTLLLNNVVRAVWVLLGVYLVFGQFSIDLLPILGGLGVVGLAVGFAAQDILANLISGVTLLLDRPFRIGDWIRTADHEGQVTGLTLRTTRLRTRDNEYVSIPNKDVAGSVVVNLSHGGTLRLNVPVSIAYREHVGRAREVLLPVMAAHPTVLDTPAPAVLVSDLGDSAVELILRCWVAGADVATYPVTTMQLREAAKEALQAAGLEIPFPHLQLHIDSARGLQETLEGALAARPERRP